MTNIWIVLPIVFQFVVAMVLLFCWRNIRVQKIISMTGSAVGLGLGIWLFIHVWNDGIMVTQAGNWTAPFGITFVADLLGATLVLLSAAAGFAVSVYSTVGMNRERLAFGYFPVLHFLIMGLHGAFLTGDIFNLYVWFEVIIISSFVLITIGGKKDQLEGAIKYVALNMLASSLFLIGIAFLYGLTGTLNMADLSIQLTKVEHQGLVNVTAALFFVAFGIKSAVFPLYFWLPASYHTPPAAVSAIFAGLLTKVGIYTMLRTFSLMFGKDEFFMQIVIIIAGLTIISGAFGAMRQKKIGKIFSYLIICHIGFLMVGLGVFTEIALIGTLFYLFHDIIVKTNLFMVQGIITKINGTQDTGLLGGMYKNYPLLSLLMAIPLFSLVGIPPLSGFWPKIFLIQGAYEAKEYFLVFSVLLGSFVTLWVIAKLWANVFWRPAENLPVKASGIYFHQLIWAQKQALLLPIVFLAVISLYMGFAAENMIVLSQRIAKELLDPSVYIETVLDLKPYLP
jgi:multicomponent Na+:H+ antiporter subunit D